MSAHEKTYPIYRVEEHWTEDGEDADWRHLHERIAVPEGVDRDAGEGRFWNSTSQRRMFREDPGADEVRAQALAAWPAYVAEKLAGKNPSAPVVTVELTHHETWCLSWFAHWTFDDGQTDHEALDSFHRFVRRMQQKNREEARVVDGILREPYCLMGAEDEWRWRGADDAPPPCRCEGCKKLGRIVICH